MPLVAGFDSSTGATKVEVRDADDGTLVAHGRAPHPETTPPRSEQDPEAWWRALQDAMDSAGVRDPVAAVSVAGQQHGMVVTDARSSPLRAAKLWNDTESAPQARELRDTWGPRRWAERTGSVPVASFTVTKLAWLRAHEPEVLAAAARVCLPHDWLTWRLCGELVTDRGDASGTGYWSPEDGAWALDALTLVDTEVDWPAMLPRVLGPGDVAGSASLDGRDVVVAPGTGDNMAAALGLGMRPGDVAISLGTSGTVYAVTASPTADASGAVAGFADATGRWLPLVCTLNATGVVSWVKRILGVDTAGIDALALTAPPGSDGAVMVPYLAGERTPDLPDASGHVGGIRPDTSQAAVARAAFEGVVCGLLDGLDALSAAGVAVSPAGRLFLVGGGARSPAFREIAAHLSGRTITVPDAPEHVAAGACVQAAAVLAGDAPAAVAARWDLGAGHEHRAAAGGATAAEVRDAYAAQRDRLYPPGDA